MVNIRQEEGLRNFGSFQAMRIGRACGGTLKTPIIQTNNDRYHKNYIGMVISLTGTTRKTPRGSH